MRAFLISAGKGTRLYPLTKNTPKSLLEVGEGLTLLEAQLHSLQEAGIVDITIIVGYRAEQIEAKLQKYNKDFNINTVYNPFYDVSNNLISIWMARHLMQDEFITINGDDMFTSSVIKNLMKSKNNITMVMDEKDDYDGIEDFMRSNMGSEDFNKLKTILPNFYLLKYAFKFKNKIDKENIFVNAKN
jgi:choline kinase